MCRYVRVVACALACAAYAEPTIAQRLPDTVVPTHYTLTFTPDLATATFTGEAEIIVRVTRPTSTIVLNALELTIHESTVVQGATNAPAAVTYDKAAQQVTLQLQRPLAEGEARVRTRFAGTLNDKLARFLPHQTPKRKLCRDAVRGHRRTARCSRASTSRRSRPRSTSARGGPRATSRSPTAACVDVPGPAPGKHTVTFATTPRMSTYLVALARRRFRVLERRGGGHTAAGVRHPGQARLTASPWRPPRRARLLRRLLLDQVSLREARSDRRARLRGRRDGEHRRDRLPRDGSCWSTARAHPAHAGASRTSSPTRSRTSGSATS